VPLLPKNLVACASGARRLYCLALGGSTLQQPDTTVKTIGVAFLIGLAAVTISPGWAAENEAFKNDLAQLQGEWSMVSGSADGQPMPEQMLKQMKRVCKGDEATVTMAGQPYIKAKITIDPSKKPKTIDYQMTDGFTKGKTQLGIYEVAGDTFKSCFGMPDAERPTDFTSKPGDGRTLSVWKRQKSTAPVPEQK
jgi:uncharacterized protein (TIGR03067 family)